MKNWQSVLFLAGGLAAGFAVATFIQHDDDGGSWSTPVAPTGLESRIDALERRLASEAAARRALSAELDALRGEIETVVASIPDDPAEADERTTRIARALLRTAEGLNEEAPPGAAAPGSNPDEARARARRMPPSPEELEQRRIQRFVEAGFTAARAEWIERRSAELQMQLLEAQYQAARSGDPASARAVPSVDEALRAELGDAEYERFLEATGRPTRIGVRSVLPSSPAEQVGIQPGDQIVSYGGKRVFDMDDLNRLTFEGRPGETVVMEVVRDGQPLQLYVPRGPIGISGGGRGRFP